MDAKMMLDTGKACGLNTVRECYENVMCHYDAFFLIDNINEETKIFEDDLDRYELELNDTIEEAYDKLGVDEFIWNEIEDSQNKNLLGC